MRTNKRIFPRIHPRLFRREDDLAGFGLVDSGALLSFHAAWADAAGANQTLLTGTGPVTTDHVKVIYALGSSEYDAYAADDPVWQYDADGDYLVAQPDGTNDQIYSNDQTNAEYTATNVTVAQDESGFAESKDACTLTATAANGTVIANAIVAASGEHAAKWYIKRKTGTGDIDLTLDNGTGWTTVTLTSDFDLFAIDQAALTNPQIGIRIVTDTDAVIVGNAECHLTSTVEKVKSLGPIFTTAAAASTSAFDNEYPAANHSNTEGPYTLEFENTGDDVALLSAGTDEFLRIEDGGSVEKIDVTIDATDWGPYGTNTLVDDGDAVKTTYVDNVAGAALTFLATTILDTDLAEGTAYQILLKAKVSPGNSVVVRSVMSGAWEPYTVTSTSYVALEWVFTKGGGAGFNYIAMQNMIAGDEIWIKDISVREVDGKYLKLTDGTTQLQVACAAGEHKVGIAFDADNNLMNLNLDGVWADLTDSTAYDDTLGSGVLTFGETMRKVKRWNGTDFDKQKAIIDREMS